MADTLTLTLEPRTLLGKKVKSLRKAGIVPVHLYGQGLESQALQCDKKTLLRVLTQAGMNTPISVTINGQDGQQLTFVREIQWDPVRGEMFHVDFLHVDVSNEITASVPITLTGDAPAVRLVVGGAVVQLLRELEIRALPLDMPSELTVNLEKIAEPDDVIRVSDISLPANVASLADLEEVIARLEIARVEPVAEEAVEEVEGAVAEEGAAEQEASSEEKS